MSISGRTENSPVRMVNLRQVLIIPIDIHPIGGERMAQLTDEHGKQLEEY